MSLFQQAEAVFLIIVAGFLGMIIGLDRERAERPAGLRTHILISIGACLFTILSRLAFNAGDLGRVAAAVVQGVGFLGAGAVLVRRGTVRGLTTAAGIWTTAAIGMTVGIGAWLLALATTLLVWFVLAMLRRFGSPSAHHHDDTFEDEDSDSSKSTQQKQH